MKVWDLDSGKLLRTLAGHAGAIQGVAVTADGRAVSASGDRTLKVWDLHSEAVLRRLEGHADAVYTVMVTANGRAVSASRDESLKVWDLGSGKLLNTLERTEKGVGNPRRGDDRRQSAGLLRVRV